MELHEINNLTAKDMIWVGTTDHDLDQRLSKQLAEKIVGSEQWFREPESWYDMPANINPYKGVFQELPLLQSLRQELTQYLSKTLKVFWGVGFGDSESLPVMWDLDGPHKYVEINAIDAIEYFLVGFVENLKVLKREYSSSKIMFLGNQTLFEAISRENINPSNSRFGKATHICLGNTIGNFDQKEIFTIFRKNIDPDDFLLLAYQLNRDPQKILEQYRISKRFERLITDPLSHAETFPLLKKLIRRLRGTKLKWTYNKSNDSVEAWLGDILVFRSKKYDSTGLATFAGKYGFELVSGPFHHVDCGISLFKRI